MFLKVRPVIQQCPQECSQNTDLSLAGSYIVSAVKYVDLNLQQMVLRISSFTLP